MLKRVGELRDCFRFQDMHLDAKLCARVLHLDLPVRCSRVCGIEQNGEPCGFWAHFPKKFQVLDQHVTAHDGKACDHTPGLRKALSPSHHNGSPLAHDTIGTVGAAFVMARIEVLLDVTIILTPSDTNSDANSESRSTLPSAKRQ